MGLKLKFNKPKVNRIGKNPNIDLTANPKQSEFFVTSLAAAQAKNTYKFLNYGGAIRGGKTFVTLAILIRLCEIYPGSRWHVVRKDFPTIEATSIPSFEKLVAGSKNWRFYRNKSNYYAYNRKGSKIFFKGENKQQDPNLMKFLGLETNGFFLEQSEELSEELWNKALERTGSWYLEKMPRGLIFMTFNPCQNWVKDKIYTLWVNGELPPEYFFMTALPTENPFVTDDQFAGWNMMAERYRKQFVQGDWTDFEGETDRWLFAFSIKKHVGSVEWNPNEPTYLSFDFNRNPITCSIWQHYGSKIRGIRVIKLWDSTIYRLCEAIDEEFPNGYFFVTGDASGDVKTTMSNLDNFDVIKSYFRLSQTQMQISASNPRLKDSRMLCNSILEKYPLVVDKVNCMYLIDDAKKCKANADHTIVKNNRKKEEEQADTLDTFRYYIHRYFSDYMKFFANS
jgi:hypothetical protein